MSYVELKYASHRAVHQEVGNIQKETLVDLSDDLSEQEEYSGDELVTASLSGRILSKSLLLFYRSTSGGNI